MIIRKRTKYTLILLGMAVFCALNVSFSNVVRAKIKSDEALYELSILQGVRACYSAAKPEISGEDADKANNGDYKAIFADDFDEMEAWVTTHVGNKLESVFNGDEADSNLNCEEIFEGYKGLSGSANGLINYGSIPGNLLGLGYEEYNSESNDGQDVARVNIKINSITANDGASDNEYGSIIELTIADGNITCVGSQKESKGLFSSKEYYWETEYCTGKVRIDIGYPNSNKKNAYLEIEFPLDGDPLITASGFPRSDFANYIPSMMRRLDLAVKTPSSHSDNPEPFKSAIDEGFKKRIEEEIKAALAMSGFYGERVDDEIFTINSSVETLGHQAYRLYLNSRNAAAARMLYNFDFSSDDFRLESARESYDLESAVFYRWDNDWIYSLYIKYLQNMLNDYPVSNGGTSGIKIGSCSSEKPPMSINGKKVAAYKNSSSQWCEVIFLNKDSEASLEKVLSIPKGKYEMTKGNFKNVLDWLGDEDSYSGMTSDDYANMTINEDGDLVSGDDADQKMAVCYTDSGSLGWIICPVITAIDGVGNHMWEQIENYHLKIPASEVFKSDGGVETGWGAMRNIANTVFIILFLMVIFSQLTGRGIDNYGIKKILPRLIVIAILVNLSYLICELAVDLSNIFGMGLNDMFSGWAGDISAGSSAESAGAGAQVGAWVLTAILGGGGAILFSTLSAGSLLGGFAGIGLAVLGILVVIIVAMLTLYLILIAREAGIVLSIIIAPVAIVCYALPNTEKYAKKWFDLFKALIIVYPICGAMVGGGQLAGSILASIDNPGMKIAAMIVQVLPFFLVPTLLKNSLSLMGNVGSKISSLGRNLGKRGSSGLRGAIRNSERFKDWSQSQKDDAAERRARRTREGVNVFGRRVGGLANRNPNTLSRRQRDRLRKADDVLLAQRKQREENRLRTQGGYYDAMVNKQDLSIEAEADSIARLNDPTVLASERSALAEKARLERSKARTTLLANRYSGEGLEQLQARWNAAFDSNHADDLDALTNVMVQRYGTSAANSIASRLGEISIIGNSNRQDSMRTLQRTMNDNSSFANSMRSKAPDAFQMVSEAGTHYDAATGGTSYEDLRYFSGNNIIATQAKDWATASGATLQRAVDNGAMSERMLEELLTSDDPSIRSGLQSEDGKREILEAALYNMRHNPSGMGPNLDNATASARYQAEQADINNRAALEADALRIGKTTITVGPSITTGAPATTFEGYAAPAGFNTGGAAPVLDVSSGHYIYTDPTTGARWNASTGRFMP